MSFLQKSTGSAICFGIFLRAIISIHRYSGENTPPMFGDFEAQRHWQEISVNLPIRYWYENTTDNDLMYWGLDYPPLTAYHSFLIGSIAQKLNASYVALHESRGITTVEHKNFMRLTVLAADILIYIPAVLLITNAIHFLKIKSKSSLMGKDDAVVAHKLLFLLYPGQILIDNGHFQYNNISLGFALLAISCIIFNRNILGAALFCLSLNYKQMELFHALPFFFYLLRKCFEKDQSYTKGLLNLIKLGFIVLMIFGIIWLPWLYSTDLFFNAVKRIFPLARGVFEDKVSNFWCIFNIVIKIKKIFTNEQMALICMISTLFAALPSCIHVFFRPEKLNFLYALINTSIAFFLFSFQVHEKTILLAALPVLVLLPFEKLPSIWFLLISVFSMFPLLSKDGLSTATIGILTAYICIYILIDESSKSVVKKISKSTITATKFKSLLEICIVVSLSIAFCLVFCHLFVPPPKHLPDLFPLVISAYSGVHFIGFFCYFNYRQMFSNKI